MMHYSVLDISACDSAGKVAVIEVLSLSTGYLSALSVVCWAKTSSAWISRGNVIYRRWCILHKLDLEQAELAAKLDLLSHSGSASRRFGSIASAPRVSYSYHVIGLNSIFSPKSE